MTKPWLRATLLTISVVLMCNGTPANAETPQEFRKKFVEFGWDAPTTSFLREHWREMEATAPFDGIMFKVEVNDDKKQNVTAWHSWDSKPWKREWFQPAVADLKACKFTKFTDNFVLFLASPGTVAWDDDAAWAVMSEKFAITAWVAKQGGAKGLALDFEQYGKPLFHFNPKDGRTFEATVALVRKRGAEAMRAIAREYPDATVFTLFLNSINVHAGKNDKPETILPQSPYALLPAFFDGMLDAAPAGMTLVDGCETGYYLNGDLQYLRWAATMRSCTGPAIRLVSAENRRKYRAQVEAGFGFYLDSYLNAPGGTYYFGPKSGGTRVDRLRDNLTAAGLASDQYVWVYGEQCKWWDVKAPQESTSSFAKTVGHGRRWEEAMPGVTQAILSARSPKRSTGPSTPETP